MSSITHMVYELAHELLKYLRPEDARNLEILKKSQIWVETYVCT